MPVSWKLRPEIITKLPVIVPGPFNVAVVDAEPAAKKVMLGVDEVQSTNR
jgi:hypothetical protein